jgi:phosphopantothenoylcysteine synthetase/decarboxylase
MGKVKATNKTLQRLSQHNAKQIDTLETKNAQFVIQLADAKRKMEEASVNSTASAYRHLDEKGAKEEYVDQQQHRRAMTTALRTEEYRSQVALLSHASELESIQQSGAASAARQRLALDMVERTAATEAAKQAEHERAIFKTQVLGR